jgi:hypothetical protein
VADGLDVVAVGVEDKGAVIIRVVLRAQTGRAVVAPAGGKGGLVEGIDLCPRGCGKAIWAPVATSSRAPIQKNALGLTP